MIKKLIIQDKEMEELRNSIKELTNTVDKINTKLNNEVSYTEKNIDYTKPQDLLWIVSKMLMENEFTEEDYDEMCTNIVNINDKLINR
jgi:hypothetical protein